ncbi:MAG TPA: hypothetical protein VGL83_08025 [Stellaceae bacterium]|jgi:hypothetical protein
MMQTELDFGTHELCDVLRSVARKFDLAAQLFERGADDAAKQSVLLALRELDAEIAP